MPSEKGTDGAVKAERVGLANKTGERMLTRLFFLKKGASKATILQVGYASEVSLPFSKLANLALQRGLTKSK